MASPLESSPLPAGPQRASFLQTFTYAKDEQRYRQWDRARLQKPTPRIVLAVIFLVLAIQVFAVGSTTGTFSQHAGAVLAMHLCSSIIWLLTILVLAVLPAHFAKTARFLTWSTYILGTFGLIGAVTSSINADDLAIGSTVPFNSLLVGMVLVCCRFSFAEMIPYHIIALVVMTINNFVRLPQSTLIAAISYLGFVVLTWEREYLRRRAWAAEEKTAPAIIEAQRNAAHDMRNALQEVLAIVEMGEAQNNNNNNNNNTSADGAASPATKGAPTAVTDVCLGIASGDDAALSSSKKTKAGVGADIVLQVRTAISRITHRLDSSLRDGRNVVMDELSRLTPVIEPCSLVQILREDLILDTQVVFCQSDGFPQTVETDSEWIRSCVQNFVHNAKKHGPPQNLIQVKLKWLSKSSKLRVEVSDEGAGPSPARAREIWRGQSCDGIGIKAVRSYVGGLGGTYGSEGSKFWFEVPGGQTVSHHAMHPWSLRFVSWNAEHIFRRKGRRVPLWRVALWGMFSFLLGAMFLASVGSAFNFHRGELFTSVATMQLIALMLVVGVACVLVSSADWPRVHWWCVVLFCLCFVAMDTYSTVSICRRTGGDGDRKFLPGAWLLEMGFAVMGPALNLTLFSWPYSFAWLVVFVDRVLATVYAVVVLDGKEGYQIALSRSIHIILVAAGWYLAWKLERARRVRYAANFKRTDLKRDLRILKLASKVRAEGVQRDAARNAAHEVSGCFNTLLSAARRMQTEAEADADTHSQREISSTMQRCFGMITEAQDHFVLMQKNSKYHRFLGRPVVLSLFDVRTVLSKTVHFFQVSGERATSIEVDRDINFFSNPNYIRQILHEIIAALHKSPQCGRILVRACLKDANVLCNRLTGETGGGGNSSGEGEDEDEEGGQDGEEGGSQRVLALQLDVEWCGKAPGINAFSEMMGTAVVPRTWRQRLHDLGGYVEIASSVAAAQTSATTAVVSQKDAGGGLSPLFSVKIFVPPGRKPDMSMHCHSAFANASVLLEDAGSEGAVPSSPSSPTSSPPSSHGNILSPSSSSCPRVLVVDDNDFCRDFVVSQIRHCIGNDRCVVNGVGTSASAALDHLLAEKEYDLVLMDMSMPGEIGNNAQSGIWVTRQYKLNRPESATRFICLSGMGRDIAVVTACKDAGMVSPYALGKPFSMDEMRELLSATFPQFVFQAK